MKSKRALITAASGCALAGISAMALAQGRGGTATATYWMTADTTSGMGAMAAGGRGGAASIMGAMMGRGGGRASYVHTLTLQLGSGARPTGAASAEHLPPPGLQAGPSLPLVTPQSERATGPATPWQGQMERPRGRMLLYWGCGDHARPGQPVVIDFATLTSGRIPAAFANANMHPMTPPSPATSATYGEWPNARSQTRVPAAGSLVGAHVVRGNYTPEIHFNLSPGQDFLAPVVLVSQAAAPTGAVPLVWRPVPGARAWLASTMGSGQNGDFVMWSSSERQMAAMAIDYLPEGEIARLVQQRVLLPAAADRCTIPAEVVRAAPQSMLNLTALGGEANFSNPPRPARASASWRPDWTVKLRTKSSYMGLLGMDMNEMMGRGADRDQADEGDQPGRKKKSKLRKGLEGILGH